MRGEDRKRLERMIISALIMNYDGLIDYLDIPLDNYHIEYPLHKDILKTMKECGTGDPVLIATKCNNIRIDELWEIAGDSMLASEDNFRKYVDELKELIEIDRLEGDLTMALLSLKAGKGLDTIYDDINKIKCRGESDVDDSGIALDILKELSGEKEVKMIKTGYRELDKLIGGFEKTNVIVVGARPGIGKSMFALNLIHNNIVAGEKVALFSLEMDKKQVYRRLVAMNSGVGVWKLKEKNEGEVKDRAIGGVNKLLEQLKTFYCFDNVHTIGEMENKIRMLVHKHGVSVVYIDYLQLIRNPSVKNNPVESITDMSQRLKQLALELKITIVELSQLNRDADKSIIKRASQLRGSGSIEQDADMVWILDKDEETSNRTRVSVQKCRDGRLGEVELQQISDIMKILDMPNKPF